MSKMIQDIIKKSDRAWYFFEQISKIPRAPDHMQEISQFIYRLTDAWHLESKMDAYENVIVRKAGTGELKDAPPVLLQAHMDMVCEKEKNSSHDFSHDPIDIQTEDGIVRAKDTTLGADNGIGMAYLLAMLEEGKMQHPPLEAVFTTNEETDMRGAKNLDMNQFQANILLNFDAQAITVSGCGEIETVISASDMRDCVMGECSRITIELSGLCGGHSGLDATRESGNAIVLVAYLLETLLNEMVSMRLISFHGGAGMSSVIPRDASASIAVEKADTQKAAVLLKDAARHIYAEYGEKSPDLRIEMAEEQADSAAVCDYHMTKRVISLLALLPEGVALRNNRECKYMGSCYNIGAVACGNGRFEMKGLIRGDSKEKKTFLLQKIQLLCDLLAMRLTVVILH